ncbi:MULTISPECIES: hypothetical protein [Nocardioides]|uniref:DUF222 domain-containing protein n=1 Tax=Nocardioides vastitatis TaxID=2568655 RepID=A0ABW0ZF92_9ACTN|nr:hypothetical protein [Nocardioides sp.]THI97918.1 hypothetical protein E7Z54_14245 [Nocardioides sp.]
MHRDLPHLDSAAILAAEQDAVLAQRQIDVDRMRLLLQWQDRHSADPQADPGAVPVKYGGDRLTVIGGEGTPGVALLRLEEFAMAGRAGSVATANRLADGLDLRHRLPEVWAAAESLRIDLWVARRVASLSRRLTKQQARLVDAAVGAAVDESASRILAIAEARVIEADLSGHEERIRRDEARKGVWLRRRRPGQRVAEVDGEPAVQGVGMRLSTAGAVEFEATVTELAQALADNLVSDGDDDVKTMDQLRAEAVELLARPHDAARFLDGLAEGGPDSGTRPGRGSRRRPATIFVHLHRDVLTGRVPGVARVEGIGPMLLAQVVELLRHRNVSVKPVIDLNDGVSVNAYEHPAACKERTGLRNLYDVFPHSTSMISRGLDLDHPTPYDVHGPPGQTGDRNAAPLTRRHHRAKTHLGYHLRQLSLDAYRWESPHGLVRVVTRRGTCVVEPIRGPDRRLLGELYPSRVSVGFEPRTEPALSG